MLKPQSSPYTVPRWAKWAISSFVVLLVLCMILSVWVYLDVNQDRTAGHEEAAKLAEAESGITTVDEVSTYHGESEVFVVQGSTTEGESSLVFINDKKTKVLDVVDISNVLPEKELKTQWSNSCSSCTFKGVNIGYEEDEPVYEITYIDSQDRYVLDYFTLTGEAFDQRFAFRQNN
ncbi:DUF5590 domain-containing protein [Halobacillus litoralis]|uniref:cell wall elongation regulator TseB-like domain-containing protein n=1 Tax=Halobacillus litoralis TaxID=45668 RepID=UPI001CFEF4BA|nr:DUF5590 domain-containing protein [Halobacillus litoralis]